MRNEAIEQVHTNGSRPATPVPALDRAIGLLRVIAAASEPLTLAELSEAVQASRSTVHSLLATLQHHGLIEKDARFKTYRLGIGVFELGSAYLQRVSLVPVFNEIGAQLAQECHETVKLAMLDGRDVVYLGKQDGLHSVRLVARVGTRMPAHATAVGKLLLASKPDQALQHLYQNYDFPSRTTNTLTTFTALINQLQVIRTTGIALDREESTLGVQCVAAAIYDHDRTILAAMSIGIPNDRLDEARLNTLTSMLMRAANAISRRLGYKESTTDEAKYANS
jgi:IclR family transcriptional regulator, KDG regulon repressor